MKLKRHTQQRQLREAKNVEFMESKREKEFPSDVKKVKISLLYLGEIFMNKLVVS